MKAVTLKFKLTSFDANVGGPIFQSMQIVKELREAGVPAVGHTVLQGVEHGKVVITNDATHVHITWEPDPNWKAPVAAKDSFDDDEEL